MANIKLKDENGVDVTYEGVTQVDVPLSDGSGNASFIIPAGSVNVTSNGTVDVTDYASAVVSVPTSGGVTGGYTVTFQSDGSAYAVFSVTAGDSVDAPRLNPTKSGYTFLGWGTSLVSTATLSFPYTPTADTTLYAIYQAGVIIGFTGLTNSASTLTWTDALADLQSEDPYTSSTSGDYVSLSAAVDSYFPYNAITTYTDDNGNVFKRIPKFWMKWVKQSSGVLEGAQIAGYQPDSDYFIPDCFLKADGSGDYADYYDYGVYEGSEDVSKLYSVSGKTCLVGITRAAARTRAQAWGDSSNYYNGYQQEDFSAFIMRNVLIMLAMRTSNIRSIYAGRTSSSSANATGSCDGVTGLWGWNTSTTCVKMLGIENPYGNISKWIDGAWFSGSTIYAQRYPMQFADSSTNGIALGFSRTTNSSGAYITQLKSGTATTTQSYAYAYATSSTASYYNDYVWYSSSGTVLYVGGHWSNGSRAGLWCLGGNFSASVADTSIGCRLCHRPL